MKTKNIMYGLALLALGGLIPATVAAFPFAFGGKLGVEHVTWEEFDASGQRSEKDSGARNTFSVFLHSKAEPKHMRLFVYGAEVKVYGGETDYSAVNSANTDYTSSWAGGSLSGELGLRVGGMPFAWDFVAMPEVDIWTRTLDDDLDYTTRDVQTKETEYDVISLGLGTGPAWRSGNWYGRIIAGAKASSAVVLINEDNSSVYNDDLEFEVEGKTTGFITINNNIRVSKKFMVTIDGYYNTYHFKRSDPESVNGGAIEVIIPESKQRNYGVQAGVTMDF